MTPDERCSYWRFARRCTRKGIKRYKGEGPKYCARCYCVVYRAKGDTVFRTQLEQRRRRDAAKKEKNGND